MKNKFGRDNSAAAVVVKQVRSTSGRTREVVSTLSALGLRGIGDERTVLVNECTRGMIRRVHQLVVVQPSRESGPE